jgi:hypothetical protein
MRNTSRNTTATAVNREVSIRHGVAQQTPVDVRIPDEMTDKIIINAETMLDTHLPLRTSPSTSSGSLHRILPTPESR